MTQSQAEQVAAWRSNPWTSKIMWALYVGQGSLALFGWQIVSVLGRETPTSVLLAMIASISALAITGVAGLSWTDQAVAAVRLLRSPLVEPPPTAETVYLGKRSSSPPEHP